MVRARGRAALRGAPAAIAVVAALAAAVTAGTAPAAAGDQLALSDRAKRELILDTLERFVPHAESFHRASDLAEPRTDYYAARGPGVTQPRGAGNIALVYATLLSARPDRDRFGGVPREVLLDHTVQSIRHEAMTSTLSGAGYDRWGGGTWQASLETYGWGWAAYLLWDRLDTETRELVRRVVVGEADILTTKPIATGVDGNTGAEDNGWNVPTPALAAVLFPEHPNRARWERSAIKLAINGSSTAADEQSGEPVDGRPLGEWVESVNLQPDLTIENHGFFNPLYQQVVPLNVGEAAAIYAAAGHAVPEGFSWRVEEVWDRILGRLVADDGDLIMPAGQDWTSKDYQHLAYLTTMATRFGKADASVAESRALRLVARRQAGHDTGAILGQPLLGYESMLVKRLAAAYWTHERFGPSPQPTRDQYRAARAATAGVHRLEYAGVVEARQRAAFTSMSWDETRPMGLVVPAANGWQGDPVFAAYQRGSLVGDASGPVGPSSCDCRDDYFSTAGTIGARRFSMTSFPDGMVLLLDRGEGATFRFAFELVPGLTGPRPVSSAGGTGLGDLDGGWANVADRFGVAVAGGAGLRALEITTGNPHLRLDGSRGPANHALGATITASSNQGPYPPQLATDGNPATYWVSQDAAAAGAPQWLEIDLGRDREISHLVMTPRTGYGPKDLTWQVPDGTGGWRDVATAVAERSGPASVTIDPVATDRVRLLLTSGHDARNVQVAEVEVGPAQVTGTDNRGAAVYPLTDTARTERLAAALRQPAVPDGWSALFARATDGTGRLAIARWSGPDRTTLELGTDRGAPLTRGGTMVNAAAGLVEVRLDAPASRGEVIRFFATSDAPIHARVTGEHHATLRNETSGSAHATITYIDPHGREHATGLTLRAGQHAEAIGTRHGVRIIVVHSP